MSTKVLPFTELIPEKAYELMSPERVLEVHEQLLGNEIQELYTASRENYSFTIQKLATFITSTLAFLTAGLFIPIAVITFIWWMVSAYKTYEELARRATIQVWRNVIYSMENNAQES